MDWATWSPWMDRIRQEFGYSESEDRRVAQLLDERLVAPTVASLVNATARMAQGRLVTIVGAADSAVDALQDSDERPWPIVAAGGGASAVRVAGMRPDVLVTDMDGPMHDQVEAVKRGATVFVHAHGDNEAALARWLPMMKRGHLAGTCQVGAFGSLLNPGGFTDGDRACFLMHALGARRVRLVGFDLDGPIGRFAGTEDHLVTRRKLAWCARLLRLLQTDVGLDFEGGPPPSATDVSSSTHDA